MALDFGLLRTILTTFEFGLNGVLITIAIVAASSFAITRNTRHLKLIIFPIALGFGRIGLPVHPILISATAILWGVTLVGAHNLGGMIKAIQSTYQTTDLYQRSVTKDAISDAQLGLQRELAVQTAAEPYQSQLDIQKSKYDTWLHKATFGQRFSKAMSDARFKDKLDIKTLPIQQQKALRQAGFKDKIDIALLPQKMKSALRESKFQDELDIATTLPQIRKGVRSIYKKNEIDKLSDSIKQRIGIRGAARRHSIDLESSPSKIRQSITSSLRGQYIEDLKRKLKAQPDEDKFWKWLALQRNRR